MAKKIVVLMNFILYQVHSPLIFKQHFVFRCIPVGSIFPDFLHKTSFKFKLIKTEFGQHIYMEFYNKRAIGLLFMFFLLVLLSLNRPFTIIKVSNLHSIIMIVDADVNKNNL